MSTDLSRCDQVDSRPKRSAWVGNGHRGFFTIAPMQPRAPKGYTSPLLSPLAGGSRLAFVGDRTYIRARISLQAELRNPDGAQLCPRYVDASSGRKSKNCDMRDAHLEPPVRLRGQILILWPFEFRTDLRQNVS